PVPALLEEAEEGLADFSDSPGRRHGGGKIRKDAPNVTTAWTAWGGSGRVLASEGNERRHARGEAVDRPELRLARRQHPLALEVSPEVHRAPHLLGHPRPAPPP